MKKDLLHRLFPFLQWWPLQTKQSLKADAMAGLTNAVVVLPQGVAFAMIAGLPPIYGLYTAMVVPIVAALFGSSWHLISGPTTAISIVLFSSLSEYAVPGTQAFIELTFTLTFVAGAMQLFMGIARLGTLVNFVSHSVVVGFTSGAAILIASSQVKHVFGIDIPKGSDFLGTWTYLFGHLAEIQRPVLIIALVTLAVAVLFKRILPRSPFMLIAMVVATLMSYFFFRSNSAIDLVGQLPAALPRFHMPDLNLDRILMITPNAFAVALLGLIEAVAIARSIALKSHQRLDGNQEFIGQGLSNIVGSMFLSYAGSGSFTRSGINYQAGAKSPMSAVFAAISLAIILLFVKDLTAYLPIAAMGGIILLVAYNLIDFHYMKKIFKSSRREFIVLLVTFVSTLFLHLEYAIYIGVILSLIFHLQKISKPRIISVSPKSETKGRHFGKSKSNEECPQLKILKIYGSLFFGATEHIGSEIDAISEEEADNLLLICNGINQIDHSGAEFLYMKKQQINADGGRLYFCGLNDSTNEFLRKSGYLELLGTENIYLNKEIAIASIYENLDKDICARCEIKAFTECQ